MARQQRPASSGAPRPLVLRHAFAEKARRYTPRRPERTDLYKLVAEHVEDLLRAARDQHERGLPRYVEQELRACLDCGIPAHGFVHARCQGCGRGLVVAFSCKRRGVCPSCNARRIGLPARGKRPGDELRTGDAVRRRLRGEPALAQARGLGRDGELLVVQVERDRVLATFRSATESLRISVGPSLCPRTANGQCPARRRRFCVT